MNKFDLVRTILTRLNQDGDASLRERREVVKRVVEFEDFSVCWESDRLAAEGLVERVRRVVGVKDAFARMAAERDRERSEKSRASDARAADLAKRNIERTTIKNDLFALFAEPDAWKRGKSLESVLNRVFKFYGMLVREAFTIRGQQREGIVEQIDGLIELDSDLYLVEMKWHGSPLGVAEVSQHLVRVFTRGGVRAFMISDSGYTAPAISACRDALTQKVIALCHLEEIVKVLDSERDLVDVLRQKVQRAIIERQPYFTVV